MSINNKRPPVKETVGAQYICFANTAEESDEFTGTYEEEVEKTEVVKSVSVSENAESTPVKASGKVYMTASADASTEISVEVIAFVSRTLARMRGEYQDAKRSDRRTILFQTYAFGGRLEKSIAEGY